MTIGICPAGLLADPMAADEATVRAAGEAARAAGFSDASVWLQHLGPVTAAGLDVHVVEAAAGWPNAEPAAFDAEIGAFVDAAKAHQAPLIAAVCLEPNIADVDRARANLGRLAEAAGAAGAKVCLEFLPGFAVPSLASAWALVEPLGPNTCILVDTWHWTRQPGGPAYDVLATIPGERLPFVQLNDVAATASADVMAETMNGRLLPGEGVVDYAAFFAALAATGADPFIAVEIFNPELVRRLGVAAAAEAMWNAAAAVVPGA